MSGEGQKLQQVMYFRFPLLWTATVMACGCAANALQLPVPPDAPTLAAYEIRIDTDDPGEAEIWLTLSSTPARLTPARDGDGSSVTGVHCEDGRRAVREGRTWRVPSDCIRFTWRIAMKDLDVEGVDASLPVAAYSLRYGYWLLPERDGLLRATDDGGSARILLRLADGRTVERRYVYPSNGQPPFYAVIGDRAARTYQNAGFTMRVFGAAPDYTWMEAIHDHVLTSWSNWRRDLLGGAGPDMIDWAWVQPPADAEPGYYASAGAEAIVSQIKLRARDVDAETKARVVIATSAAHEGFHTITGAAGQAWPAWVNESLASHYAVSAARRFLVAEDHPWLEALYQADDTGASLLDAQTRYAGGDREQAQIFYTYGARFWNEIEAVLTNAPNGSGRLAALIHDTNNFEGVDLANADAVAVFLDRHSGGRARPLVRCFLVGECPRK